MSRSEREDAELERLMDVLVESYQYVWTERQGQYHAARTALRSYLSADKRRMDWLEKIGTERRVTIESRPPAGLVETWTWTAHGQGLGFFGGKPGKQTLRENIDSAMRDRTQ